MSIGVVGAGAVGRRVHQMLEDTGGSCASSAAEVVILASPVGTQADLARALIADGRHVVCTSDGLAETDALLALAEAARRAGVTLFAGAGMSPGVSCLLARHLAARVDEVLEIHVAKYGTGGPACALQHHEALGDRALDWRDGEWVERPGGSGRELCWFPDPIDAHDCYSAALAEPRLLVAAFPSVTRVTARMAATRRDRVTARLPMLRKPHPEGMLGAVRVEVRGTRGRARVVEVASAAAPPALATAATAVAVAGMIGREPLPSGAFGTGVLRSAGPLLQEIARAGVRLYRYDGHVV